LKLFLLGKRGSIVHWLEDAASAFAGAGHEVRVGITRRPWLNARLERALAEPIGEAIARRVASFEPELILAIGAYHVPSAILARVAAVPGRAPLIGWVGDVFDDAAGAAAAGLCDAVGYTDSGLLARHKSLNFPSSALFLPHAVDPRGAEPPVASARRERMVFVANPTPARQAVVDAIASPIAVWGPSWRPSPNVRHEIHARRIAPTEARRVYRSHFAALNIRNEFNVLTGLNQRNFEPCLAGAALITDDQPDLGLCFEPGAEVWAWRDVDELNDLYARALRDTAGAAALGARGRARVLASHTYERRLDALKAAF
jgi:spore maturation protein CgeB